MHSPSSRNIRLIRRTAIPELGSKNQPTLLSRIRLIRSQPSIQATRTGRLALDASVAGA